MARKRGLPAKYAKMGFAKGWREYKKTYKGRTTKRKVVGVKKVARKRRYTRRAKYRRKKRKIPLETIVALGAIPFTPSWTGGRSLIEYAQTGDYSRVGETLAHGFLGFAPSTGKFPIMNVLNPFDMGYARFTKMLIWSGVMSKIRKSVVRIPFDKVPLIGKYIS